MKTVLLTEIIPYVLKEIEKDSRRRKPHKVSINLMIDGSLLAYTHTIGGCLCERLNGSILKQYIATKLDKHKPWRETGERFYCCGYPRLEDSDLPSDWRERIKIDKGHHLLWRQHESAC